MISGVGRRQDGLEHVVVSDVHLNEVVNDPRPEWWAYKGAEAVQDRELVAFFEAVDARRPASFRGTELIFNGDTFDFDLVYSRPDTVQAPLEGLPPSEDASVYKMRRILADHPRFVAGLASFIARGNQAVFVMGNHDRELCFESVQEVMRSALVRAAPPGAGEVVAAGVHFEPWFVYRAGVFYLEHGQQYDSTCSYRDVLQPVVPADRARPPEVETPFGSLLGRHTLCRLGTFNPYNDESFIMSFGGYIRHWREHYFRKHPFFWSYVVATVSTVRELGARRRRAVARSSDEDKQARYRSYADAKGVSHEFIDDITDLASVPIADRTYLLLHELWLDRLLLMTAVLLVIIIGLTLVQTWEHGLLMLLWLPAAALALRAMGRGSLALQERSRWGLVADRIAAGLGVPVVAFGHSHRPERRPLTGGGRYYNLGSWAPVLPSDAGSPLSRARRYLVIRPTASGSVYVCFERWSSD